LQVALDVPLRTCFDYLPPKGCPAPPPGTRVWVRFGRSRQVGVVFGTTSDSAVSDARLRRVEAVIDEEPVLGSPLLELLRWAADYYVHPPGEVCAAALPALLRQGRPARRERKGLKLTPAGAAVDPASLSRAPRQAALLRLLAGGARWEDDPALAGLGKGWRAIARRLAEKGWVEPGVPTAGPAGALRPRAAGPTLTAAQARAVEAMVAALGHFRPLLLHGVTGSGKTEVYLAAIETVLGRGEQALILVPEIGLTPQLLARFRSRFAAGTVALHSGLSSAERLEAWRAAREGRARIVIGTRSAVFTPMPDCGLIVVDEEHDPGPRRDARPPAVGPGGPGIGDTVSRVPAQRRAGPVPAARSSRAPRSGGPSGHASHRPADHARPRRAHGAAARCDPAASGRRRSDHPVPEPPGLRADPVLPELRLDGGLPPL
jgi:primosomal protein N' (replication factor Y)